MFKSKLEEISKVMSLRSAVLSEYFVTLMTNHNIKSIRNGMKVLIFYFYCEIVSSHITSRGSFFRPFLALLTFVIYFLIYAATVKVDKPLNMMRFSSIMVIISMAYTVVLGSDILEIIETHYSLSIVVILMMYTLFRLKFLITMMLSIVYILIFVSLGNYRMKFIQGVNLTSNYQSPLRAILTHQVVMTNRHYFIAGQCILFCLMYVTGMYLRFVNSIRRKSAFQKLAQNAEAKMKMKSALEVQDYWIEAIMPSSVKDHFLKSIRNNDLFNLVYCEKFENVSILFADIVGFTAMSSNKTAAQLVYLLNDLYNKFDEHGKVTNCEKIGTLGDCYYCVSGCPIPRPDHAMSCIEMGLGMCRLILKFNREHKENVNMRVGVHSGRVLAAIIGNHRFRFDVFSNDVNIANLLESSGRPGLVHLSDETHKHVRHAYVFEEGDLLEVKKEQEYGLSGMMQSVVSIKTYFVIPNNRNIKKKPVRDLVFRGRNFSNKSIAISKDTKQLFWNKDSNQFQRRSEKLKDDLKIIQSLEQDPERTVEFFKNPPLNRITLTFTDREIEYHYLYHTTDQIEQLKIDTIKLALFIDTVATVIFNTILVIAGYLLVPQNLRFRQFTPVVYFSGFIFLIIVYLISFTYKSEIKSPDIRFIYCFFSHPLSRLLLSVYISSLPSILVLTFYKRNFVNKHYEYTIGYYTLTIFGLIGNCISTAAPSLIKHITTAISTCIPIYLILSEPFSVERKRLNVQNCSSLLESELDIQKLRLQCNFSFQLIHLCLLIYYLTRENEKNIRINFYATREAEIRNAEAIRAKRIAESLLYNIIPKHVFAEIVGTKWNNKKEMTFTYARGFPNAGVIFACISNFFSTYYREDYKEGIVALKVLHSIICTFDNLLQKPIYSKLEKIKTINDCYMLASGLNDNESIQDDVHLITLMMFALDMHHQLRIFNTQNIVGSNTFYLKIGYNYGPVTAGIIGTSKPLYDIWGDTVNVASRMYSTSPPCSNIQVPGYVADKLKNSFEFKYRGMVTAKGKGEMETYLVVKSFEKTFLFLRSYTGTK